MTSYGAGADGTTPLQLQQEVVNNVDLPVLIPAMNTERLLTPQQNSHLENRLYPPQERCRELTAYICGKGDDGLMRFYRCLRTTAATHVGHGRLADSMLQHWPWLSQYMSHHLNHLLLYYNPPLPLSIQCSPPPLPHSIQCSPAPLPHSIQRSPPLPLSIYHSPQLLLSFLLRSTESTIS